MDSSGHNPAKGDRIPVPLWNRMVRATNVVEQSAHAALGDDSFAERASNIVIAKNTSGATIERYGIVKFSGVQTDPAISAESAKSFCSRPILSIDKPSGSDVAWGIAVDPIANDKCGRVAVGGAVPAKLNIGSASHRFARTISNSTTALESSGGSAGAVPILWKEAGTGNGKWSLVMVGSSGPSVRLGKTTAQWAKGSLATISVFEEGTPPSETAKTPADTLEQCVNKFATVASGKWVMLSQAGNGYWYLISAECG